MSTYKNRTTPGVYVTEFSAFPNSIPGVATAIPAFIGYTEKCEISGKQALLTPMLINSLADYTAIFGNEFNSVYGMSETAGKDKDGKDIPVTADTCDFAAEIWDDKVTPNKFETKYYIYGREQAVSGLTETETGAKAGLPTYNLYDSLRMFYANGGGTCYVVSVGLFSATGSISYDDLSKGLTAIGEQVGPTMLVIPDAVLLPADPPPKEPPAGYNPNVPQSGNFALLCKAMLDQCAQLQDRVAIIDVYGTQALNPKSATYTADLNDTISSFQKDIGEVSLNYGMAYFPFLITSIIQPSEITYLNYDTLQLQNTLKNEASSIYYSGYPGKPHDPDKQGPVNDKNQTYKTVEDYINAIGKTEFRDDKTAAGQSAITSLNQNLVNAIPLYKQMTNILANVMSMLPPSGAMAGIYTANDATRGVWNAPANVVLNSVVQPSVRLNGEQQGPLNVPINGKAIDVIRDFVGRGPVVWGARTLDGNSRDYRYVQVRRTLIYCETSIKTALNQFVFAPNDGKTWVGVVAMVSAFLQNLWAQGGLMGDKPDEAFNVQCGLGSTMTAMDVLDGYMIVQVTLQMIRPAEFIELTFKQKMEGVA